jgi:hypothetical protein
MEPLLPQHQQLLDASGIAPEVAAERGYRSSRSKAELRRLGFGEAQAQVPALLIPIWGVSGETISYQARPDQPRRRDDKPVKYETPIGARMALDVPPRARPALGDPAVPLFITEGVRKADAAVSRGLCCVALLGVWNWRGTNEQGGKTALADWERIALNGRPVYLVFDSDVMVKPPVHQALARLKAFLEGRGAHVAVIYLPPAGDGAKVGLDDFLAAGHDTAALLALARPELRDPEEPAARGESGGGQRYWADEDGLLWQRPTRNGPVTTRLTNFGARVLSQTIEDDGVESRRLLEVEARCHGRTYRFEVPAPQFDPLNWVTEQIGVHAVVYAGQGLKDHARTAMRLLSGEVPERRIYAHTGWREREPGRWVYLHAGGAIDGAGVGNWELGVRADTVKDEPALAGPNSQLPIPNSCLVRLTGALQRYRLPEPPTGEARVAAVRACVALLELAPLEIMAPVVGAIWRAALGGVDFSAALVGPSGVFKSELAALAQQHFGAGMDARHLPGSWSSTENALEGLAFAAKDALLVIDDFAPTGPQREVQRLHAKADRVLRAQGNTAGRQRMRADSSLRDARPPRGLILSTGEDVPLGFSLRSRMLIVEVAPGDIEPARLTQCQRASADGQYAAATAAFLAWTAPRYAEVLAAMPGHLEALRDRIAADAPHRRTPMITAHLGFGLLSFLTFAQIAGALTADERANWWHAGWSALTRTACRQADHQAAQEPARRFLELLSEALAAGRAHVANRDGGRPEPPAAWGWREEPPTSGFAGASEWHPQGPRLGWTDGSDLYLLPNEAYRCARRSAADEDGLSISVKTLTRRLHERGFLASTDRTHHRLLVRRIAEGRRHHVLHLRTDAFSLNETYPLSQTYPTSPSGADEEADLVVTM